MKAYLQKLKGLLDRWATLPGIDGKELAFRKLVLAGLSFNFTGNLLTIALARVWGLPVLFGLLAGMNVLILLSFAGVYFRWRSHQDMYFIIEIWSTLYAFLLVVVLGGIPHSGGIFVLGLTAVMTSLLLEDFRRIRFIFLLFLATVILAGILQPLLDIEPQLSPGQNLIFFLLFTVSLSAFMLQFNRTFWKQRLDMEQMKIRHLEEVDRLKERFYINISHEFRTPLTVILGMASQIREKPAERYLSGTQLIERNGRRLLRLVNQMLDLVKLESGVLPVHYVQTDVILQLRYILESFHSLAEDKTIQLDFSSDADELFIDVDREKLEHIISNLLINALKFTEPGGTVRLTVQVVDVAHSTLDASTGVAHSLVIQVADTGIGIAPENLDHIFDRFYQIEGRKADVEVNTCLDGGMGIGLAIAREYVLLLEGDIYVDSEPGVGTTFTICLPVRRQAPRQETSFPVLAEGIYSSLARADSPLEGVEKIEKPQLLIVEDNRDVATYLEVILREYYELQIARNGREGLEQALEQVPDIIISDVMMPVMDGFEMVKRVKEDVRTSHIPIILLTAKADMASRLTGLERGADAYLSKPFHPEELLIRVKKLIELRRKLQEKFANLHESPPTLEDKTLYTELSFLQEVRRTLEDHLSDENFGVQQLCQAMQMSRAQLYRKFKALTDQSVGKFMRRLRLRKAKDLLENTDLNVTQVALEVGFRNLSHFSQSFTEEFGFNPSNVVRSSL